MIKKWYSSCKKSKEVGNYINHKCQNWIYGYSYYEGRGDENCYNERIDNTDYYKVHSENKYYQCYKSCVTCVITGDSTYHRDSCGIGFIQAGNKWLPIWEKSCELAQHHLYWWLLL